MHRAEFECDLRLFIVFGAQLLRRSLFVHMKPHLHLLVLLVLLASAACELARADVDMLRRLAAARTTAHAAGVQGR